MSNSHEMYVCDLCGYARYHPLTYCPKCPGKLKKKDIPHPPDRRSGSCFKTAEEQVEWLKEQGLDYSWDECTLSPCAILMKRRDDLEELESFCYDMRKRSRDWEIAADVEKWLEHAKVVREAKKQIIFLIAKVAVPQAFLDEAWAIYKPFWENKRDKAKRLALKGTPPD